MDNSTTVIDEVDALLELSDSKRLKKSTFTLTDVGLDSLLGLYDHILVFGLHITIDIPIDWAAATLILKSLSAWLMEYTSQPKANLSRVSAIQAIIMKHDSLISNFNEKDEIPLSLEINDYVRILNKYWSIFSSVLLYSKNLSGNSASNRIVWVLHTESFVSTWISFFCFVALSKHKPGLSIQINSDIESDMLKRIICHFMPNDVNCLSIKQDSADIDEWVKSLELLSQVFQIKKLRFMLKNEPSEKSLAKLQTLHGIVQHYYSIV